MTIRHFISTLLLTASCVAATASPKSWEEVERLPGAQVENRTETPSEAVVTVTEGYVYIAVNERTNVKIFTILGQLIVQDTLQPGVYRYRLSARGIYLLKIGSTTRRVTL